MMRPWKEFLIKFGIVIGSIVLVIFVFVCVDVTVNAIMLWQLGR